MRRICRASTGLRMGTFVKLRIAMTVAVFGAGALTLTACTSSPPSLEQTCTKFKEEYSYVLGTALAYEDGDSNSMSVMKTMDDLIAVTSQSTEEAFVTLTSLAESVKEYAGRNQVAITVNEYGQTDFGQLAPTVWGEVVPLCETSEK